jgi:hypothetical protein
MKIAKLNISHQTGHESLDRIHRPDSESVIVPTFVPDGSDGLEKDEALL